MSIGLSLVVPAYNESKNLLLLLERADATIGRRDDAELIVVDNGSSDGTGVLLDHAMVSRPYLRKTRVEKNQGYGFGILSGLKDARGGVLAWTHADMQTDIGDALSGFELFRNASDPKKLFVKGRRYGRPFSDVVFTVGMAAIETALLSRPLWDINAQPTMFSRAFFEQWSDPPWDFSLDLYAYALACRRGLEIRRFPVHFGARAHGRSHWNFDWRSKFRLIGRTLGYSFELRRRLSNAP